MVSYEKANENPSSCAAAQAITNTMIKGNGEAQWAAEGSQEAQNRSDHGQSYNQGHWRRALQQWQGHQTKEEDRLAPTPANTYRLCLKTPRMWANAPTSKLPSTLPNNIPDDDEVRDIFLWQTWWCVRRLRNIRKVGSTSHYHHYSHAVLVDKLWKKS